MKYKVDFTKAAEEQLESIPKSDVRKILKRIEKLSLNPFPLGFEKLKGSHFESYRIRQGDYRVLYAVYEDKLLVLVIKIGHRKEVYRDF